MSARRSGGRATRIGRITSAEASGGSPWPAGESRAQKDLSEADKNMCLPHRDAPGVGSRRYINSMYPEGCDPDWLEDDSDRPAT